jgi:cytochrome P450
VVSRHEDLTRLLRDPGLFSSKTRRGVQEERPLIPFEVDPPELLAYRRLLQPFFTLSEAQAFVPTARELVTKHLDGFVSQGRCDDLVSRFARPLASEIQWSWLVGLDELDHAQLLDWMMIWLHKHFEPEFAEAEKSWVAWIQSTIDRRRREPRRKDLIDTLLHEEMNGRRLTDDEIIGVVLLLIIGGVPAVTDVVGNLVLRLAVDPELQDRLRSEPELIPQAIEESVRRVCVASPSASRRRSPT